MPTVVLRYKLPEEQEQYELAMKGPDYCHVLWSLDQEFFRANIKYGVSKDLLDKVVQSVDDKSLTIEQLRDVTETVLQICRERMWEVLSENGVTDL